MATNVISCVVGSADYAEASNASVLPLHKLNQSIVYNADGTMNYLQVTSDALVYRRTFSYDAALRPIGLTKWTLS